MPLNMCVCSVAQSCLTLCKPMTCSRPGSSVHRTRILEWVDISFSGDLPDLGIRPTSPVGDGELAGGFSTTPAKPSNIWRAVTLVKDCFFYLGLRESWKRQGNLFRLNKKETFLTCWGGPGGSSPWGSDASCLVEIVWKQSGSAVTAPLGGVGHSWYILLTPALPSLLCDVRGCTACSSLCSLLKVSMIYFII